MDCCVGGLVIERSLEALSSYDACVTIAVKSHISTHAAAIRIR